MFYRKNIENGVLESRSVKFSPNIKWEIISEEEFNVELKRISEEIDGAEIDETVVKI